MNKSIDNRYLLVQLSNFDLVILIDDFYKKLRERDKMVSRYKPIATKIITSNAIDFFQQKFSVSENSHWQSIFMVKADVKLATLEPASLRPDLEQALLYKESPKENIKRHDDVSEVIDILYTRSSGKDKQISKDNFIMFWKKCIEDAEQNSVFQFIWESTKIIENWGQELLDSFLTIM